MATRPAWPGRKACRRGAFRPDGGGEPPSLRAARTPLPSPARRRVLCG